MRQRILVPQLLGTAIFALLSITVTGQQQQTGPPTPAPSTPNTPSTPTPGTRTPTPTQPGQQRTPDQLQFPEMQRPMFLSGKVIMEDGTPPPESVTIERICNGVARPEGVTDSKGRFSFELGRNTGMFMDASVSSPDFGAGSMGGGRQSGAMGPNMGIRERDLLGCELRAALPGFRSDNVNLSGRRFLENPDIGTIVLRRMGNVEGLTISATSLTAPKDAKKALEKAREAAKKNKLEDAQKHYEKALEIYPKYAVAWHELGTVHDRRKDPEAARKAFSEALAVDQKFISPYDGLAQMAARENNWQEVADITDRMLRLNPVDFPRAYFYNAVAKLNLQKLDEAEKSATQLLEMDPNHRYVKAEHVLGLILAQKQDYANAAVHIRKFITTAPAGTDVELAKKQLDQLEKALAAKSPQP
jgi:tetratricopeptide (TPR) repeat protein